ncbi:hypothetical protein LZC95_38385 [Pendulispora brunnea]|uniref:Glycosyltransferase RgtA/B/C/D-like domain-containing protein n=1 Tax=Pendulispora brunnea TaxID=2905690 RepID=A0ABZ2K0P7_9BACT
MRYERTVPRTHEHRIASGTFVAGIILGCVAVSFFVMRAKTGGSFVYPLDDSYIHLALAKNLADQGIYGITSHEFTPASSSIVWPLLLAALRPFYKGELGPLALNAVFAALLATVVDRGLRRDGYGATGRVLLGSAILLATPIVSNVLIGMEHTLHMLATLLLVHAAVDALAAPKAAGARSLAAISLFAMIATSARYETLFAVAILGLLALIRRRLAMAVALGIGAGLPVVGFALFSMAHDAAPFPYPVLIKRQHFGAASSFAELVMPYVREPHLLALLVLLALAVARAPSSWERRRLMLVVAAVTMVLHTSFAKVGWLFRYESYVVLLSLVALAGPMLAAWERLRTYALAFALLLLPLTTRGAHSLIKTPKASYNIYEQQMQMARFVARYYPDQPIAIQDVGAISYFSDPEIVDLIGLGSPAVARLKLAAAFHGDAVDGVVQGRKIAIVYDKLARPSWRKVGSWRIADNVVCEEPSVSFYAIDHGEGARLVASLREFAPSLPATVEQSGEYLR